jgi:carbamoyl-phosphate synthase small subunit
LSLQGLSILSKSRHPALADGTFFVGQSIAPLASTNGEVVFNTAMTSTRNSYRPELLSANRHVDLPAYGNYGVNVEVEAEKVHAAGLIIKDLPLAASNFRTLSMTLSDYLVQQGMVAIAVLIRAS